MKGLSGSERKLNDWSASNGKRLLWIGELQNRDSARFKDLDYISRDASERTHLCILDEPTGLACDGLKLIATIGIFLSEFLQNLAKVASRFVNELRPVKEIWNPFELKREKIVPEQALLIG